MAPRTDRRTCIPSGVASPVTTNHAAKGSVFVNLRNIGNLKNWSTGQNEELREMQREARAREAALLTHFNKSPFLHKTVNLARNPNVNSAE